MEEIEHGERSGAAGRSIPGRGEEMGLGVLFGGRRAKETAGPRKTRTDHIEEEQEINLELFVENSK